MEPTDGQTLPSNGHKLVVPTKSPFVVSTQHKRLLEIIHQRSLKGQNDNILIRGSTGMGKSEFVNQIAATTHRPLAILEVGQLSESRQIFGYMTLRDGQTTYVPGLFTEAIATPNAIVHLQELNRPESDKALNALFAILDYNLRSVWIDELGHYIHVAPGVTFFATLNEGYEFIGTMPLDAALEDRFPFKVKLGYLPANYESSILILKGLLPPGAARDLVDYANSLRHNVQTPIHVSTRDVVYIASLMRDGLTRFEAIQTVIGGDPDKLESILLTDHLKGQDTEVTETAFELM